MILGITDLLTFVIGTIFIVLLPGPNSLYVMTVASRFGVLSGYRAAIGVFVGDLILIVLSSIGVASALKAIPAIYIVLKYAGALYLIWLGLKMIWSSWKSWQQRHRTEETVDNSDIKRQGYCRTALLVSLLNPKAIVFYISFFIQFVDPSYAYPGVSFLILGCIVQFFSMLYLTLLIFGGAYLASFFRTRKRFAALASTVVGGLFIAFGAKLSRAT